MSIEVRIPKEITEYQEKIIFGMSVRQLICLSSAVVLSIGTYILLTSVLGLSMNVASYVIVIESLPLMAIGFLRKNGLTFEKYAALFIRHKVGLQIRKYKTELLIDQINTEEERGVSKYAWIFEKENTRRVASKKEQKEDKRESERKWECYKTTKKKRRAKRKTVLRKIKTARKEQREIRRRKKKAA